MFGKTTGSHCTKIEVELVASPVKFAGGLWGTVIKKVEYVSCRTSLGRAIKQMVFSDIKRAI